MNGDVVVQVPDVDDNIKCYGGDNLCEGVYCGQ